MKGSYLYSYWTQGQKNQGVHILSELASEIIHEAALAIKQELSIDEIIDTVHIFPAFTEAIKITAQAVKHDPQKDELLCGIRRK